MNNRFVYTNVKKDINNLLKSFDEVSVPEGIRGAVFARISREEVRLARIKIAFFAPLMLASAVGAGLSLYFIANQVVASGFLQYLSILFSDSGAVFAYWREFSMTLVEHAPLLGLVLFSGALFTFLESLRVTIKNTQITFALA